MAKFEIITMSIFENHYFVEANTLKEALEKIDEDNVDFMQKHLGEDAVEGYHIDEDFDEWMQSNRDRGFM